MTARPGPSVVEEFVESQDRRRLFLRSWRPGGVRAVVAIVHEPGSDGARYRRFAETLAARGIATCAIDLPGYGRSPGPPRRIAPIDGHLPDVRTMMSRARQRDPARPLFMLGHGIGAALACHYALRHEGELDGIVCEGILLDPPWRAAALRKLARLSDALRLPGPAPFRPGTHPRRSLGDLSLPLLLLHGSQDRMASPAGGEYLHRRVRSRDKTLLVFEGYGHDLIDGPGHALVWDKTCRWIEAQLDSSPSRRRIGIEYING